MVRWMRAWRLVLVSCRAGAGSVVWAAAVVVMRVTAATGKSVAPNFAAQRAANFRRSIERKLLQYKTWRAEKRSHRSIRTSEREVWRGAPPLLLSSQIFGMLGLAERSGCKIFIPE